MELPAMGTTHYGAAMTAATPMHFVNQLGGLAAGGLAQWALPEDRKSNEATYRKLQADLAATSATIVQPKKETTEMADATTRLVKIFIVDPNQNVPLDKRLIYRGDEVITDLTDQELFFDIDIAGLLKKHNEFRVTVEDKKANKDKPVMLEAARVRDLKMQVIVLAQF